MKLLIPALLFLFVGGIAPTGVLAQSSVIDSYVNAHAAREKAEEYADARKVIEADVNSDGIKDKIVLYTLEGFEGGNSYIQYLAVFLGRKNGEARFLTRTEAGGKGRRSVELQRVAQGKIFISTKSYKRNDPSCCPTILGRSSYRIVGSRLIAGK